MYLQIIDATEMNTVHYRHRTLYCQDEGENFSFRERKNQMYFMAFFFFFFSPHNYLLEKLLNTFIYI